MSKKFVVVRDGEAAGALRGAAIAIGNFDGMHRGHRAVIEAALARARASGKPAAALTLEPHPRSVFKPDEPVFRLTNEHDKLRLMAGAGLDGAIVLTFDKALAGLSAENFIDEILVKRFGVSAVAIGFDFHFGKGRAGSPDMLTSLGASRGFVTDVIAPLSDGEKPVSSGRIRDALREGDVAQAADLFGHPYFVSGEVVHGEKRGRDLGYPTANMRLSPDCQLRHGIYAVRVRVDGVLRDGVASYGRRPTFDNGAPLLETFLFDFAGDLYGKSIDVALIEWIRPELKFDSLDALIVQMNDDSAHAKAALAQKPDAFPVLRDI